MGEALDMTPQAQARKRQIVFLIYFNTLSLSLTLDSLIMCLAVVLFEFFSWSLELLECVC